MLVSMAYLFVALPLEAGFLLRNAWYNAIHVLTTVLFALDIAGSFVTGYQVGKTLDHVELKMDKVAWHYVHTWLLYDVLFSLPWRFVIPLIGGNYWIATTPVRNRLVPSPGVWSLAPRHDDIPAHSVPNVRSS